MFRRELASVLPGIIEILLSTLTCDRFPTLPLCHMLLCSGNIASPRLALCLSMHILSIGFVSMSATISFVGQYSIGKSCFVSESRTKWYPMSICFVLVLEVSFFQHFFIALILSTKVRIGSSFCLDNAKETIFVNRIASLTAVDSAMYSASADESATQLSAD